MRKIPISLFLIACQLLGRAQDKSLYSPVSSEFLATVLMTDDEKNAKAEWMKSSFGGNMPLSFIYHGKASRDLLKQWRRTDEITETNSKYTITRISFSDQETGLVCYTDVKEFNDYPAVEWTVHFRNNGNETTPILENIRGLSTDIPCPYVNSENGDRYGERVQPELYYSKGSQASVEDFLYKNEVLTTKGLQYACSSGYSSSDYLPFFNMKKGKEGLILAIGWTGKWECSFTLRHEGDTVKIEAGLEKTHLKLFAGEEIRTPETLFFFWKNNMDHAYNMFRRFMLNFHTPKQNGLPITMPIACCTWGGMKEKSHLDLIKAIKDQKLDYDCYWIDAGWYGPKHEVSEYQDEVNDWAKHVGNWNVNEAVLPHGFQPVTAAAHGAGMKTLLWFEPERARKETPLTREHPEFFLETPDNSNLALNLGNPDALKYITGYISDFLAKNSVDIYRQDCNFDLAPYWEHNDPEDRIGITEIKYITGLYQFWDELRRRHPGMYIDNCASGGRRIDIESLDRSVIMSRSDYCCGPTIDPIGGQTQNYGIMHWVPLTATINYTRPENTYSFRSDMNAGIQVAPFDSHGEGKNGLSHIPPGYPFGWHKKMMQDYKRARPFFYGDYYTLTNSTLSAIDWTAYQLDRPDLKEGIVLAFKRPQSPFTEARFALKGIDEKARYQFENADSGEKIRVDGKTIAAGGFTIKMQKTPESQLWYYREIK